MSPEEASGRRVAIVTGATSGIGRAVAERLTSDAFTVVGLGLGADRAGSVGFDLHEIDVRDRAAIDALVAAVLSAHGRVDVLCNIAGIKIQGDILALTGSDLEDTFAINVHGAIAATQAVLPTMITQQSGAIINVGSPSALADPSNIAYAASKAAIAAITTSLALDLVRHHIRVNLLVPGSTRTGMNADRPEEVTRALGTLNVSGRVNDPDDVAAAVSFLVSDAAATISGAQIDIGNVRGVLPTLPRSDAS